WGVGQGKSVPEGYSILPGSAYVTLPVVRRKISGFFPAWPEFSRALRPVTYTNQLPDPPTGPVIISSFFHGVPLFYDVKNGA
ncbi:MAG: hypothetical protein WC362_06385, partial [Methanoregula sp.]